MSYSIDSLMGLRDSPLVASSTQKARRAVIEAVHPLLQLRTVWAACAAGDATSVRRYVEEGGSVNEHDGDGVTPLHICARRGHVELMGWLLGKGADLAAKDQESGWTPLHTALYHNQIQAALLLLQHNAQLVAGMPRRSKSVPAVAQLGSGDDVSSAIALLGVVLRWCYIAGGTVFSCVEWHFGYFHCVFVWSLRLLRPGSLSYVRPLALRTTVSVGPGCFLILPLLTLFLCLNFFVVAIPRAAAVSFASPLAFRGLSPRLFLLNCNLLPGGSTLAMHSVLSTPVSTVIPIAPSHPFPPPPPPCLPPSPRRSSACCSPIFASPSSSNLRLTGHHSYACFPHIRVVRRNFLAGPLLFAALVHAGGRVDGAACEHFRPVFRPFVTRQRNAQHGPRRQLAT